MTDVALFQHEERIDSWVNDWWWIVWTGFRWKIETNVGCTENDLTLYDFLPKNWEFA